MVKKRIRAVTDADRWPQVPLVDEMRLLEAYGELLCARQPERVTLRFDVDPFARDCPVPTLALQPLLDNAFRNTADRRVAHAQLVVRARCEAGRLELTVDDDAGELDGGEDGPGTPAGMGLAHLRERLALLYGNAASLRLLPREGGGVSARLSLPCASC